MWVGPSVKPCIKSSSTLLIKSFLQCLSLFEQLYPFNRCCCTNWSEVKFVICLFNKILWSNFLIMGGILLVWQQWVRPAVRCWRVWMFQIHMWSLRNLRNLEGLIVGPSPTALQATKTGTYHNAFTKDVETPFQHPSPHQSSVINPIGGVFLLYQLLCLPQYQPPNQWHQEDLLKSMNFLRTRL